MEKANEAALELDNRHIQMSNKLDLAHATLTVARLALEYQQQQELNRIVRDLGMEPTITVSQVQNDELMLYLNHRTQNVRETVRVAEERCQELQCSLAEVEESAHALEEAQRVLREHDKKEPRDVREQLKKRLLDMVPKRRGGRRKQRLTKV